MKKLLHVIASPRGEESRTLKVSSALLEAFREKFPDAEIDNLDLFKERLPDVTSLVTRGKYALMEGSEIADEAKVAWEDVDKHIERFLSADIYVISTPMWNFSIPYVLKHYIDLIVQPKRLFQYTENGVEGLARDKKMAVVTSRGGDYGPESPFRDFDHQAPYLRTVFGFVGIDYIRFIHAQPMDTLGTEIMLEKIQYAKNKARRFVDEL